MNTYNLKTVEEATRYASDISLSTNVLQIPFDQNDNPVEYLTKFRAIIKNPNGDQMIIFDTEQEYRDWVASI